MLTWARRCPWRPDGAQLERADRGGRGGGAACVDDHRLLARDAAQVRLEDALHAGTSIDRRGVGPLLQVLEIPAARPRSCSRPRARRSCRRGRSGACRPPRVRPAAAGARSRRGRAGRGRCRAGCAAGGAPPRPGAIGRVPEQRPPVGERRRRRSRRSSSVIGEEARRDVDIVARAVGGERAARESTMPPRSSVRDALRVVLRATHIIAAAQRLANRAAAQARRTPATAMESTPGDGGSRSFRRCAASPSGSSWF